LFGNLAANGHSAATFLKLRQIATPFHPPKKHEKKKNSPKIHLRRGNGMFERSNPRGVISHGRDQTITTVTMLAKMWMWRHAIGYD
jgi:hypothetical protein